MGKNVCLNLRYKIENGNKINKPVMYVCVHVFVCVYMCACEPCLTHDRSINITFFPISV